MQIPQNPLMVRTNDLLVEWFEAEWDSDTFGYPVLQISRIELLGPRASVDLGEFEAARDQMGARLVSCRLSHSRLKESMLLEDHGFRFIEMVYSPELTSLDDRPELSVSTGLNVQLAEHRDIDVLMEIARSAFRNERFHIDPRLDSPLADKRYQNWVRSSQTHSSQKLYAIRDGSRIVSFFVTENMPDGTTYWHLNAVATDVQGMGYGRRVWIEMLRYARESGAQKVRTSIVARNHRVLNLYAKLGFLFPPPLMTFHWVAPMKSS